MTSDVSILGVGMIPFVRQNGLDEGHLVRHAVKAALDDAGLTADDVDTIVACNVFGGPGMGQAALRETSLVGRPIVNVENACASGASGILDASAWIKGGMAEVVLVVGVEIMTGRFEGGAIPVADDLYTAQGYTLPALYALKARYHMERYGTRPEHFDMVTVKNRAHGAANPLAAAGPAVSLDEVARSRMIADPIRLLHCCRNADGAAAAVLATAERARGERRAVRLVSSKLASGRRRAEIGWDEATLAETATAAYEAAGIAPVDVDVAEVHDSFAPAEILAYERLQFTEPGKGGFDLAAGHYRLGGPGPTVNPSGGLLARGHPAGATGVAQVHEIVTQLRGEAGGRQVDGARIGLTLTAGGTVPQLETNACVVHLLAR